jgi:hypothetical protein
MSSHDANGMPGANAMGDTMEFVKGLWGAMKLPGMSMPSLSPEDIDKQIADLKAVESWLQMNMNMLRSTIQALEVQSATLNALRSVSQSFANAAHAAGTGSAAGAGSPPPDVKPAFDSPFDRTTRAADPDPEAAEAEAGAPGAAGAFPDAAAMAAQFAAPAAWWNTVQEQFSNAVGQALAPAPAKKSSKRSGPAKKTAAGKTTTARKRTPKA